MPPFVIAECTNAKCKHKNRYDLAELKKDGGAIYKGVVNRAVETDDELAVTCEKCGQPFKITIPRDISGGMRHAKLD